MTCYKSKKKGKGMNKKYCSTNNSIIWISKVVEELFKTVLWKANKG